MAWFKVDDLIGGHWKARKAGKAAMGLWVVAGSYAAQQLTDGFVPEHFVVSWDGRKEAARLVSAGLWRVSTSGSGEVGWQFHDWADYQPTRTQVLAERERTKERQRRFREHRSGEGNAVSHAVTNGVSNAETPPSRNGVSNGGSNAVSNAAPTRPVHKRVPKASPSGGEPSDLLPSTTPDDDHDALTSQHLVAEWIDHSAARPPGQVVGQVAKHIGTMLAEGIPYATVRSGLEAWSAKGVHPSALASFVHAAQNGTANRSTTNDRVRQGLDVAQRLAAQEGPR